MPSVIKENGLVEGDLNIEFDADYLADFTGTLVWDDPLAPQPTSR
jgi:hypothetical protein